ncbi:prefoldin subunit 3 [Cordyceps militaris CM01]|uniref:Prefoldin subunit 3 n=1 Tax=Cordyceps militaris (strain CM01) TaxID=983644 RepID=G3J4E7_CORMM|nr:prefoldin subunit 3 [Cordyceps militaris CM01]EGX96664.1 prefoldin subunit 3 [Cordyceps militaris CM01]
MASQGKQIAAGGKEETLANPRGIPTAPFVDKVEDYVTSRGEVEGTLQRFQELISKYQFMEMNLQRRMAGLKDKIPDIQKTLDTVQFMKLRKDESEPIETTFELNDTLYARANIPPTEEVYIWLGANVMLSYPINEAQDLLESKLKSAKTSLSHCEEDLDFIREQITGHVCALRVEYLLNRHMHTSIRWYDDTRHTADHRTARAWSSAAAPARNAIALNDYDSTRIRNATTVTKEDTRRPKIRNKVLVKLRHADGQEYSHMQFLTKILEREKSVEPWELAAAQSRDNSIPIILAHLILKNRAAEETADGKQLSELLPSETEMGQRIEAINQKRQLEQDTLRSCAHILSGKNDDQRCQRLLEYDGQVPVHVLLFLLRRDSALRDISTLRSLIERYKVDGILLLKSPYPGSVARGPNYLKILSLLEKHIARTEPRLLVNLAEAVSSHMTQYVETGDSAKRYVKCCRLFNNILQIFQPESNSLVKQLPVANAYFWECQRILLTMSETFERPLQVNGDGFRTIRNTLAGMPKNEAEKHSALLHAPSWPPYLTPGDGMDEITDPEANWSRTVEAGMLMQEAGFAKSEADDSLDILKGMAPNGTPTIQQRTLAGSHRTISTWEASIRATRDAHEAWARFNDDPSQGATAGVNEYAAMFEKLTLREVAPTSKLLPGDKAQNFPAYRAANLADIEWAKSRPPSVEELYSQMRQADIIPSGHCLFILVSNAPDLNTAHRYLETAAELDPDISSLISPKIERSALRRVGMGLFSAYINMLARRDDLSGWENLQRAISLAEARLGNKRSRWASLIWGAILKGASRHHSALRMSQSDQVELIMAIAKRIDRGNRLNLANFAELNKSLRKLIRYDLRSLVSDLQQSENSTLMSSSKQPLRALYEAAFDNEGRVKAADEYGERAPPMPGTLKSLMEYIKSEFAKMQARERSYQAAARDNYISPLDRMLSRNDVVRSEHALEYMMTLGYAGEFDEMKKLLLFLIHEWGQADLVQDLVALDELPPSTDFSELLCVFRLLGEPMLGGPVVAEEAQDAIVETGLPWTWPDTAAVDAYMQMHQHDSIRHVRGVLAYIQAQKRTAAQTRMHPLGPNC